jgi:signal transduction histidine kinase
MLDVSRIMAGKMDLEMHPLALEDAVSAAIESAGTAASARGVALVPVIQSGSWIVNGNAERLQQVFNNLLSNAIKFSQRGEPR